MLVDARLPLVLHQQECFTAVSHNIEKLQVENFAKVVSYLKHSRIHLALEHKRSYSRGGDSPSPRLGRNFFDRMRNFLDRTSKAESAPNKTLSCERQ